MLVNNTFRHNGATSIVISPVLSYGLNLTVAGNAFYRNEGGIEVQYLEAMPVCALAFLNNTFVDNRGTAVTLTIADLPHSSVLFRNNIITGSTALLLGAVLSLQLDGDLDFANNRIAFNDGSVALTIDGKNVTARIADNVFLSNRASGLQVDSSVSPFNLLLRGNTFANNTAGRNTYYSGGALLWIAGAVKAVFEANLFLGNSATQDGGAVSITQSCLGNATNSFFFNNDLFQDNRVSSGMGGAASITSCPDIAVFMSGFNSDSSMVYNRTWDYRTHAGFQNVSFQRNEARCAQCQGGALHLVFGTVTAKHCRFSENQAGSGGAITVEGESTSLSIHKSVFTRNRASAQGGDVDFESGGTFLLHNVSTEVEDRTIPCRLSGWPQLEHLDHRRCLLSR